MKLRRGLLLALIQLVLAVPLLSWNAIVALSNPDRAANAEGSVVHAAILQEFSHPETVNLEPCSTGYATVHLSADERLVAASNMPASIVAGWATACPARWTLAGLLNPGSRSWDSSTAAPFVAGFSTLIAVQWLLAGALPVSQPKRWWNEPGAFITLCSSIGAAPLLAADAIEAYRWRANAILDTHLANGWLSLPAEAASLLIMLAWCGWALVLASRGAKRLLRGKVGSAPTASSTG